MRALIRAELVQSDYFISLWKNREEYDKQVCDIFLNMGYTAVVIGQENLENNPYVKEIFEDLPPDIGAQDKQHYILLGYSGEGQSHFVVSSPNPAVIHIRVMGRLFGRLRRTCTDITHNLEKLKRNRQTVNPFSRKQKPIKPFLKNKKIIEVMEPMRDHPTILGEIITSPFLEVIQQHQNELLLTVVSLIGFVILFFTSPSLARIISNLFSMNLSGFSIDYILNVLEQVSSAMLVSFVISAINIFTLVSELKRLQPIKWDFENESKRKLR